jgi:hypothetical protein
MVTNALPLVSVRDVARRCGLCEIYNNELSAVNSFAGRDPQIL